MLWAEDFVNYRTNQPWLNNIHAWMKDHWHNSTTVKEPPLAACSVILHELSSSLHSAHSPWTNSLFMRNKCSPVFQSHYRSSVPPHCLHLVCSFLEVINWWNVYIKAILFLYSFSAYSVSVPPRKYKLQVAGRDFPLCIWEYCVLTHFLENTWNLWRHFLPRSEFRGT